MSYQGMGQVPKVQPIADPWYQQKARELQTIAASTVLADVDASAEPPPVRPMNVGMMVGWGAVLLAGVGVFWATTRKGGTLRPVAANRSRRRTSRRRR